MNAQHATLADSIAAIKSAAGRPVGTGHADVLAWLALEDIGAPAWLTGEPVSVEIVAYLMFEQKLAPYLRPAPTVGVAVALLDRTSTGLLARCLYVHWRDASAPWHLDTWMLPLIGALADDTVLRQIRSCIRLHSADMYDSDVRWSKAYSVYWHCRLLAFAGQPGLAALLDITETCSNADAGLVSRTAMLDAARLTGTTIGELLAQAAPRLGIDDLGVVTLDGDGALRFRLQADGTLAQQSANDALADSAAPESGPALTDAQARQLRILSYHVQRELARQLQRLRRSMGFQHSWSADRWLNDVVGHPILRLLACRLVWAVTSRATAGQYTETCRPVSPGAIVDADGAPVQLPADAVVCIAHRSLLGADLVTAWRRHFGAANISALFYQLDPPHAEAPILATESMASATAGAERHDDRSVIDIQENTARIQTDSHEPITVVFSGDGTGYATGPTTRRAFRHDLDLPHLASDHPDHTELHDVLTTYFWDEITAKPELYDRFPGLAPLQRAKAASGAIAFDHDDCTHVQFFRDGTGAVGDQDNQVFEHDLDIDAVRGAYPNQARLEECLREYFWSTVNHTLDEALVLDVSANATDAKISVERDSEKAMEQVLRLIAVTQAEPRSDSLGITISYNEYEVDDEFDREEQELAAGDSSTDDCPRYVVRAQGLAANAETLVRVALRHFQPHGTFDVCDEDLGSDGERARYASEWKTIAGIDLAYDYGDCVDLAPEERDDAFNELQIWFQEIGVDPETVPLRPRSSSSTLI